jgi:hypothetical protein
VRAGLQKGATVAVGPSPDVPSGARIGTSSDATPPGLLPDRQSGGAGQVLLAAWALVACQAVLRGAVSASGYLYSDDFVLQSRAARWPMFSSDLLLTPHNGDLIPGGMVLAWVITRLAPLSSVAVTMSVVVLQVAASSAVLVMLLRLFGPRRLVLVPLVVFLFSPLTLPTALWWSTSLTSLPLQLGLALAIWIHVGYLRGGGRGLALAAFVVVATTCAFSAKAALIPLALVGITWIVEPSARSATALRHAVLGHWRLWLAYLALATTLVVASAMALHGTGLVDPPPLIDLAGSIWHGLVQAFGTAAVGGPVSWVRTGPASAVVDPQGWFVVFAWGVLLAVAVASGLSNPCCRRAWLLLVGYVLADLAVLAYATAGGPFARLAPLSLSATADAAPVLALTVGVAVIPLQRGPQLSPQHRGWGRWTRASPAPTLIVATYVFVLVSLATTLAYARIWSQNPARPWVEQARSDLAAAQPDMPLLSQPVPPSVLDPLEYPDNLSGHVFLALSDRPPFASQTSTLLTLDATGHLVPGQVIGAEALPPPDGSCWLVEPGSGETVELGQPVASGWHAVHLTTLSGEGGSGSVTLGDGAPQPVEFQRGLGDVYLTSAGSGGQLLLTIDGTQGTVCVGTAQVGRIVPDERP